MLAEAYYDDGKIEFTKKIQFKHARFKLRVEVPDEEIAFNAPDNADEITPDPAASSEKEIKESETGKRLDAILGPLRGKLGSMSPQEVKDIWHQHLEEKYLAKK